MASCRPMVPAVVVTALFLFMGSGCGGGKPAVSTSTDEATVSGTVKISGQLVTTGEVVFDPSNYLRNVAPRTAPIGADGTYKITTLVGANIVRIDLPDAARPAQESSEADSESDRESEDANRESVEYEEIHFDVQKGDNVLNIELPRPAQ